MESLDTTILNTAVPAISAALHVAPLSMKAVLASYTLSLAVFIPISGWMADRFGTRRVFASAIGLFTLGSFLCGISHNIHVLVACRVLQGMGGAMMVPVGRLTLVRTFAKSELLRTMSFVSIPALVAPMLGPIAGGLIVGYFHWRVIFFLNIPIGLIGLVMVYLHLPDYREETHPPLDLVGLILFGSGIALLSYVLEVFGEHTLSPRNGRPARALAVPCSPATGSIAQPRVSACWNSSSSAFAPSAPRSAAASSRASASAACPSCCRLLYQVGLGFTPIQSGLLIMPQAIAAMSMKVVMPRSAGSASAIRGVLISNTLILGAAACPFATIGLHTPVWMIVLLAFFYGAFTSLQYTSMNTLVYADITEEEASSASSIASTMQQMSISFGVAAAGLTTAFFVPEPRIRLQREMIHGIHKAFLVLGMPHHALDDRLRQLAKRVTETP